MQAKDLTVLMSDESPINADPSTHQFVSSVEYFFNNMTDDIMVFDRVPHFSVRYREKEEFDESKRQQIWELQRREEGRIWRAAERKRREAEKARVEEERRRKEEEERLRREEEERRRQAQIDQLQSYLDTLIYELTITK